ncbi:UNVERIFIED_CONTAM: hypothetical protein FKN15_051955, partial [Acipenser sinensis]
FRVNEFGVLEVITDEAEVESGKKAHATTTWAVPTAQEETQATPFKEEATTTTKGELCCEHCHECGPPQDFLGGGKFCSEKCMKLVQEISREQKLKKEAPKSSEEDVSKCIRKRKNKASENMKEQQKENRDEAGEEEDDPFWLTTLALRISLAYGLQTILSDYPSCLFARIWSRRSRLFFNLTWKTALRIPVKYHCS